MTRDPEFYTRKRQAVEQLQKGQSISAVAKALNFSKATVKNWADQLRENGFVDVSERVNAEIVSSISQTRAIALRTAREISKRENSKRTAPESDGEIPAEEIAGAVTRTVIENLSALEEISRECKRRAIMPETTASELNALAATANNVSKQLVEVLAVTAPLLQAEEDEADL
jgi:Mn-dependent DtxR family transcriptional regulator